MNKRVSKNFNIFEATDSAICGAYILTTEKSFRRELYIIAWSMLSYFVYDFADAVILSIIAVMIVCFEAVNTSIENICDYINPEYDYKIKVIKDLAAVPIFILIILFVVYNVHLIAS